MHKRPRIRNRKKSFKGHLSVNVQLAIQGKAGLRFCDPLVCLFYPTRLLGLFLRPSRAMVLIVCCLDQQQQHHLNTYYKRKFSGPRVTESETLEELRRSAFYQVLQMILMTDKC